MARPIERTEIEALYRKYGALVRRRARGILGDDSEAQDATQEVFVRVIHAMNEFRGQSQPSTWLYRITTNLCLNKIRDGRRRREHLAHIGADKAGSPQSSQPADASVTLRRILPRLDAELSEIAIYYYVDGLDQAEIADLLGVSRRTIGYRLDRFHEEARRILGVDSVASSPPPRGRKAGGV